MMPTRNCCNGWWHLYVRRKKFLIIHFDGGEGRRLNLAVFTLLTLYTLSLVFSDSKTWTLIINAHKTACCIIIIATSVNKELLLLAFVLKMNENNLIPCVSTVHCSESRQDNERRRKNTLWLDKVLVLTQRVHIYIFIIYVCLSVC